MPLARFNRLPIEKQTILLDAAESYLASAQGRSASFNDLVVAMDLPRASAYTYFDGREDLVDTVIQRVEGQLVECLGSWSPTKEPQALWAQWEAAIQRVLAYLTAKPNAATTLKTYVIPSRIPAVERWIHHLLADARALGLTNPEIPVELIEAATLGVLQSLDAWALEYHKRTGSFPDLSLVRQLLTQLWGAQ